MFHMILPMLGQMQLGGRHSALNQKKTTPRFNRTIAGDLIARHVVCVQATVPALRAGILYRIPFVSFCSSLNLYSYEVITKTHTTFCISVLSIFFAGNVFVSRWSRNVCFG